VEKFLQALVKNTPLALIVVGLALGLVGASGGVARFSISVPDNRWKIFLAALGVVVTGLGALVMLRPKPEEQVLGPANKYKLKITEPWEGAIVKGRMEMGGTYEEKPPEDTVMLIEQSTRSGLYWFKRRPVFDHANKRWFADWTVSGEPNRQVILHVATLGKGGQALSDYYFYVSETTKQWPGIKNLPPDVELCDHVRVIRG
jgi:hypothetical protein